MPITKQNIKRKNNNQHNKYHGKLIQYHSKRKTLSKTHTKYRRKQLTKQCGSGEHMGDINNKVKRGIEEREKALRLQLLQQQQPQSLQPNIIHKLLTEQIMRLLLRKQSITQ